MYFAEWGKTGSAGCFLDSDFNILTEYKYRISHSTFADGVCVARGFEGGYELINTQGEVLGTVDIDEDKYSFDSSYGTTLILKDNSTGKYAIENANTGNIITDFKNARFITDGKINAERGGFTYIYSADGSLLFDGSRLGYTTLTAFDYIDDVYIAAREDGTLDVVNSKGAVLFKGAYGTSLEYDGGGVYCVCSSEKELATFDSYGNLIGRFTTNGDASGFRFINGLISVPEDNGMKYYTPAGDMVVNMSAD